MSDIFICYSRKDVVIASKIEHHLLSEGWSVFIDKHIDAGYRWSDEIENELAIARGVLVLWSEYSIKSRFVKDEANDAAERGIIVPARIEDVRIPYGFRQFQTPDLIGWNGEPKFEQWQLILVALRKRLNGETKAFVSKDDFKDHKNDQQVSNYFKPDQAFRDELKIGGEGPLMVVISPGRFLMGSPVNEPGRYSSEGQQHEVQIAQPFAMGVYTVTFDDYDRFCQHTGKEKPGDSDWGRGNRPVINVSWHDAQDYCAWLSEQTGLSYSLPSEAEWEYACRAGKRTPYYTGASINPDQANFDRNVGKTTPVGSYLPNDFGLYDMHGNVWEWCRDRWHGDYQGAPVDGSSWEEGESISRVLRGGSWSSFPDLMRASLRSHSRPDSRYNDFGFRVLCSSPIG